MFIIFIVRCDFVDIRQTDIISLIDPYGVWWSSSFFVYFDIHQPEHKMWVFFIGESLLIHILWRLEKMLVDPRQTINSLLIHSCKILMTLNVYYSIMTLCFKFVIHSRTPLILLAPVNSITFLFMHIIFPHTYTHIHTHVSFSVSKKNSSGSCDLWIYVVFMWVSNFWLT